MDFFAWTVILLVRGKNDSISLLFRKLRNYSNGMDLMEQKILRP